MDRRGHWRTNRSQHGQLAEIAQADGGLILQNENPLERTPCDLEVTLLRRGLAFVNLIPKICNQRREPFELRYLTRGASGVSEAA